VDDHSDVHQAFQILGGGADGEGEVSVDKLKDFTSQAQLPPLPPVQSGQVSSIPPY